MCISTPKVGATQSPAPQQTTATDLQLGSGTIFSRNAGIYGRLALTGGGQSGRNQPKASAGSPSGSTSSSAPGGTIGLPSDFTGDSIYGGLRPDIL